MGSCPHGSEAKLYFCDESRNTTAFVCLSTCGWVRLVSRSKPWKSGASRRVLARPSAVARGPAGVPGSLVLRCAARCIWIYCAARCNGGTRRAGGASPVEDLCIGGRPAPPGRRQPRPKARVLRAARRRLPGCETGRAQLGRSRRQ